LFGSFYSVLLTRIRANQKNKKMQNDFLNDLIENPKDKACYLDVLYRSLLCYTRELMKDYGADQDDLHYVNLHEKLYRMIKTTEPDEQA